MVQHVKPRPAASCIAPAPRAWAGILPMCGVAATALLSGCQTYEPKPIDPSAHYAHFLERDIAVESVAEYARRTVQRGDAPGSFDPSDGYSLEEGEAVALVYNADLRVARLEAGEVAAEASTAGLWEDPVLGTDIARIIESTEHPWKVFGTISLTIPISGRLELEKARAGSARLAALHQLHLKEWETRIALRREWARWSAAIDERTLMREFLQRLDRLVTIVSGLGEAGEMPRIETRLFHVEHASRRRELIELESRVLQHELALRRLMGVAPTAPVNLVPGVRLDARNVDRSDVDSLQDSARIAASLAELEVRERALELEVRKQFPDLSVGPGFGNEDGDDQVLLGVLMPLPLLNRNQQGIAMAAAARDSARARVELTVEQLVAGLAEARQRYASATEQRRLLEEEIVPMVDQQLFDSQRLAELGEMLTSIQLETLQGGLEAKQRFIEIRLREQEALLDVVELLGPMPLEATAAGDAS